jgi:hypothetical protein
MYYYYFKYPINQNKSIIYTEKCSKEKAFEINTDYRACDVDEPIWNYWGDSQE